MQGVVSRTVSDLGSRLSALRGVGNGDGAGLGWAGLGRAYAVQRLRDFVVMPQSIGRRIECGGCPSLPLASAWSVGRRPWIE